MIDLLEGRILISYLSRVVKLDEKKELCVYRKCHIGDLSLPP